MRFPASLLDRLPSILQLSPRHGLFSNTLLQPVPVSLSQLPPAPGVELPAPKGNSGPRLMSARSTSQQVYP